MKIEKLNDNEYIEINILGKGKKVEIISFYDNQYKNGIYIGFEDKNFIGIKH